jgi:hypothetical protein
VGEELLFGGDKYVLKMTAVKIVQLFDHIKNY